MRRIAERSGSLDSYQVAILATLHLADEAATVREEFAEYRERVAGTSERIQEAVDEALD